MAERASVPSWRGGPHLQLVDFHTHVVDPELPTLDDQDPVLPVVKRTADRVEILVGGRVYRTLDERAWCTEARLRDMDADGVAIQVLSPLPGTLCHDASAPKAAALATLQNEHLSRMVAEVPDRFRALGTVPLQDTELAVVELKRLVLELGFIGVEIGTRVGGMELSDERLRPFFRAACEFGAIVFIHPVDRVLDPRLSAAGLDFGVGMPGETAVAAAAMLTSGLLDELPDLVAVLAHGGGALPQVLPRVDHGRTVLTAAEDPGPSLVASARRLWSDSLTYDVASLDLTLQRFGLHHVVLGTDYPLAAREHPAGRVLHDWDNTRRGGVAMQIGHTNGMRLVAPDQPPSAH
ncbi:amidohydrolase family protein [Nocardioides halotolerans]|uniref:amidohydrolase family protein n=1 Tax=Nocardioides halotolerans TaxID=433660 RepID=UPI000421A337|nr:amidohydrolase family protein [Nocardioides halotolerans]